MSVEFKDIEDLQGEMKKCQELANSYIKERGVLKDNLYKLVEKLQWYCSEKFNDTFQEFIDQGCCQKAATHDTIIYFKEDNITVSTGGNTSATRPYPEISKSWKISELLECEEFKKCLGDFKLCG